MQVSNQTFAETIIAAIGVFGFLAVGLLVLARADWQTVFEVATAWILLLTISIWGYRALAKFLE